MKLPSRNSVVTMLVQPFLFINCWFVNKYFLLILTSIKQKIINFRRNSIKFQLKAFKYMIRLISWNLKWVEILLFPFLVNFYPIMQIKSDKPDKENRFLILWLHHNYICFFSQIYEKKNFPLKSSWNIYIPRIVGYSDFFLLPINNF